MAYSDIGDVTAGDPVTESYLDQIRANFIASAPDAFTTKGDLFVATAADAGARLAAGANDSTLVAASGAATGLAWQIQPSCRVYNSGAIDPATSTWVSLTFDTERFDTDTMHSTAGNTSRITVPANGDGLYLVGAHAELATNGVSTGEMSCGIRILLNGATVIAQDFRSNDENTTGNKAFSICTYYSLVATDYVEVQIYTTDDVNVSAAGNYSPEFWAIWERMP